MVMQDGICYEFGMDDIGFLYSSLVTAGGMLLLCMRRVALYLSAGFHFHLQIGLRYAPC